MPPIEKENLRQQLLTTYEGLSPPEQSIVQLLSIIYDTVTKTSILDSVRKCGIRAASGKAFSNQSLTPELTTLVDKGVVERQDTRFRCHRLIVEELTRRAVQEGSFEEMAKAAREAIKIYGWSNYNYLSYGQGLRELRIAFYQRNTKEMRTVLANCAKQFPDEFARNHPYLLICNNPFDEAWLRTLPEDMLGDALRAILESAVQAFVPADQARVLAEALLAEGRCVETLRYPLAEHTLLRGDLAPVKQLLGAQDTADLLALRGWMAFLAGANEDAIQHYEAALKLLRKETRKRKIFFDNLAGVFFIMALLRSGETARLQEALDYIAIVEKAGYNRFAITYGNLRSVILIQQGQLKQPATAVETAISPERVQNADGFFYLLSLFWTGTADAKKLRRPAEVVLAAADAAGYRWFAAETAELLAHLGHKHHQERAEAFRRESEACRSIIELFARKEPWEHILNALIGLKGAGGKEKPATTAQSRLVWQLKWYANGFCTITPKEQKRDAHGNWTKGRPVGLKRLYAGAGKLDFLTPQDSRICASIRQSYESSYSYYGNTVYEIDYRKALPAMAGHPLVFWEDSPQVRVEVIKGEPELLITPKGSQLLIEFSPKIPSGERVIVTKETPTRLKVIEITKAHQEILNILGDGLLVPAGAKERVLEAIATLTDIVTVQSSVGGVAENVEEVTADAKPHLHLLPFGAGLKLEILVKPFATGGPSYRPGAGGERVIAEVDGKRLQTQRNLRQERKQAKDVIAAVPSLARLGVEDWEWTLDEPEDGLEALVELQALGDKAVLEWPEGEKFKISQQASLSQFRLNIRRQKDWFSATGELRLDKDKVLNMRQLLELLQQTPGRFLPLGEGQFLALTREFRKRLEDLASFTEPTAQGVRFHPLAALALEELTTEAGAVKADQHWKTHLRRLREAESLQPVVPSTLQAELREYQVEGFQWLARLAHWGVGACLADDMGLGKTIQALTLILTRAQDGPALVVTPTSVCMNWLDECRRFAPTLNAIAFGGGDRRQMLEALGPFDVLVCSYGLLQQEAKLLAERHWQTIVLDEAQAIKNMATKRSQAAMTLQGGFKMLTTGTPIENHLGELWNLFRFLNPGLLGSLESFNRRFAVPIERDQDTQVRGKLKRLIQPFILRRLKSQVLEELPARTEILLHVEMGAEEMALYEALRQQALEKLAQVEGPAGQKHLQILAEIMKLRRACCNPRLVLPDTELPSAKLAVFQEVLEELLDNRHKALVFSQFVDHLSILRDVLDRQEIPYQYLDGSTPAPERKKRVDAFQAGQGDVFLISLKAGGLGLNLTAADYVIHMDPWWNPAVEDQAADRAHRIGQQRPVTIYRLVVKDTIEEKIVDLHHRKRDLAESLLEGAGASGKVSAEELLRLLEEG